MSRRFDGVLSCVEPAAVRAAGPRVLYWSDDTAKVPFETGIQRVTRRLADALAARDAAIVPIGWNPRLRRVETRLPRAEARPLEALVDDRAILFVPEVPLSLVLEDLDPIQLGRAYGVRTAALVHDLIPLKLSADYPPWLVDRFRRYVRQFASADLVVATTHYVADDLRHHLRAEGLAVPRIDVVPLPAELPAVPRRLTPPPARSAGEPLRLVVVTTWEPRKNLVRFLKAFRAAAGGCGAELSLDLVGRRGVFLDHDEEVLAIARQLPNVAVRGRLSDAALAGLYETCHASVYPSLEEGFGLPIGESLWLGRPCLCHHGSAMAEVARGGGTLQIDMTSEAAMATALTRLATQPELASRLAFEAALRPLRTWADYAADVFRLLSATTETAR